MLLALLAVLVPRHATAAQCSWKGHCLGAACTTENDCNGNLICRNGKCANPNGPSTTPSPKNPPASPKNPPFGGTSKQHVRQTCISFMRLMQGRPAEHAASMHCDNATIEMYTMVLVVACMMWDPQPAGRNVVVRNQYQIHTRTGSIVQRSKLPGPGRKYITNHQAIKVSKTLHPCKLSNATAEFLSRSELQSLPNCLEV